MLTLALFLWTVIFSRTCSVQAKLITVSKRNFYDMLT